MTFSYLVADRFPGRVPRCRMRPSRSRWLPVVLQDLRATTADASAPLLPIQFPVEYHDVCTRPRPWPDLALVACSPVSWGESTPQTMPWRANDHVIGSTFKRPGWTSVSRSIDCWRFPRRLPGGSGSSRLPCTGESAGTESSSSMTTAVKRKRWTISRQCCERLLFGIGLVVLVVNRLNQKSCTPI